MLGAPLGEIRLALRGASTSGNTEATAAAAPETPPDKIVTAAELGQPKAKLAA